MTHSCPLLVFLSDAPNYSPFLRCLFNSQLTDKNYFQMRPRILSTFTKDWNIHKIWRTKSWMGRLQGIILFGALPRLLISNTVKLDLVMEHYTVWFYGNVQTGWSLGKLHSHFFEWNFLNPLRHISSLSRVGRHKKKVHKKKWLAQVVSQLYVNRGFLFPFLPFFSLYPTRLEAAVLWMWRL